MTSKRLFFGVPAKSIREELIHCQRQLTLTAEHKPVKPANFHLTLHFLGTTEENQIPRLIRIAKSIQAKPFTLYLDHFGLFSRAKCVWIGPSFIPDPLSHLVNDLQDALRKRLGLVIPQTVYRPHITLFRKVRELPRVVPGKLRFHPDRFCLYESISSPSGVKYVPLSEHLLKTK